MDLILKLGGLLFICISSIFIGGECNSCEKLNETYHLNLLDGVWPVVGTENPGVRYEISLCRSLKYDSSPEKENCANSSVCALSNGTALSLGKTFVAKLIVPLSTSDSFNIFMIADNCEEKRARAVIAFTCGNTLGSPELTTYGTCLAYFNWRTSAACKVPPERKEVPCYVIDDKGNKMDLTDLIKSTGYYVQTGDPEMKFLINVCTDVKDMPGNCPSGSAACRIINNEAVSVGELKSGLTRTEEGLVLMYESDKYHGCNGAKSSTKILFRCPSRSQSRPPRLISRLSCQYEIEWETEYACPERLLVSDIKTCQFTEKDHGVQIDLSPLRKETGDYHVNATVQGKNVDFYLNVCGGLNMTCNGMNWKSVSVCLFNNDEKNTSQVIGKSSESELKYADGQVILTYGKGKCSSGLDYATSISFICDPEEGGPQYVPVDDCVHMFQWKTPHACRKEPIETSCIVQKGDKTINLFRLQKSDGRAWEAYNGRNVKNREQESYFMNVCGSVSELHGLSGCGEGTSLCMKDKDNNYVSLGHFVSAPVYDANMDSVLLQYTNGSTCNGSKTWSSLIRFICSPGNLENPELMSVDETKCLYEFEWRSAAACPLGRIVGSDCSISDSSLGLNVDLSSLKSEVYKVRTPTRNFQLGVCQSIPNPCSLGNSVQNVSACEVSTKPGSEALVIGHTTDELLYMNGYVNLTYQVTVPGKPEQDSSVSIIFLCNPQYGRGIPIFNKEVNQSYEFHWYTDIVCEETIATSCIIHDEVTHNVYDLSSLSRADRNWETMYSENNINKRLYINVCRRLVPGTKCDHKASACVVEYDEKMKETKVLNVGQLIENPQPRADHYLQLNYSNGLPCMAYGVNTTYTTIVHFVCASDPSLDQGPKFLGVAGNCQLLFLWTTKAACPTGDIIVNNTCQLTDPKTGFNFDFSSLRSESSPYTVSSKSWSFQMNICGPVKGGCFNGSTQISAENVSVCEAYPNGTMISKRGSSEKFSLQLSKERDLSLIYEGNDKDTSAAIIRLMCMNGTSEPIVHYIKEENGHTYFEMKTPLACETEYFQCQFRDARGNDYDLSPLASNLGSNYVVGDSRSNHGSLRYHLNFCRPLHRISLYNCSGGATAACQINTTDTTGIGLSLGTQYRPPSVSSDGTISIQYTDGSDCNHGQFKRSTRINLFCSKIEGVLVFVGETAECEYIFSMNTPYACPLRTSQGSNCAVTDPVFGYRFDLKPLMNSVVTVDVKDYQYHLSVCNHLDNVTEKCKSSAVCQTKPLEPEFAKSLGVPNSNLTYNKGILALKYESGTGNCHGQYNRSSVITFTCDHRAVATRTPDFVTEAEDCTYVFHWPTVHACPPAHVVECSVEDDENESIYDLSKLSLTNDNYYVKARNKTFIINVCRSVVHTPDSMCPYYSAACLYDPSNPTIAERAINIGDSRLRPYIENGNLRLRYTNGQPCKESGSDSARFYETIIDFICDRNSMNEELEYIGSENCTYYFDWTTKYACPVTATKSVGNCSIVDPVTGFQFNLTSLRRDAPYKVQNGNHLFSMNICGFVKDSTCVVGTGVCQEEVGTKRHWNLGNSNSDLQLRDNVLFLNYSGGDSCHNGKYKRNTIIQFQCDKEEATAPTFLFESDNCTYYFTWKTKLACQFAVHCVVENGNEHFDLSPLSVSGVGIARSNVYDDDGAVYFINICGSLSNTPKIPCPLSASICRLGLPDETGEEWINGPKEDLGTIARPPFIDFEGNPTTIYNGGSPCPSNPSERHRSRIIYICDPNEQLGSPALIDIDRSICLYLFEWRTSLVCPSKVPDSTLTTNCMYKDSQRGIYFDLSTLRKNGSYIEVRENESDAYFLNICDTVASTQLKECSSSSVCYQKGTTIDNYGALSTQQFFYDGKRLRVTYKEGDDCPLGENGHRSSEIIFACNPYAGFGQPRLYKKYTCLVIFLWETNLVCRNFPHPCIFDVGGNIFDLHHMSSITHNWDLSDDRNNTYYINLCRGIMQNEETAGCPPSSVICMKDSSGSHMSLGMTYTVSALKSDAEDLLLTYDSQSHLPCIGLNLSENVNATTRIFLSCGNTRGSPQLLSGPDSKCFFDFSWKTNLLCPEKTEEVTEEGGILYDKKRNFGMDLRNILNMTYSVIANTSTDYYIYLVNLDGTFHNQSQHFENCNSAAVCQTKPGNHFNRDIGSVSTRKFYLKGGELHLTLHSLTKTCGKQPTRNVTSVLVMQCSTSLYEGTPKFLYETAGCDYIFTWDTSAVCPNFSLIYDNTTTTFETQNAPSSAAPASSHQAAVAMSLIGVATLCLLLFILYKPERRAAVASKFRVCFSKVSMPRFRYKRMNGERRVMIDNLQPKSYSVNDDDDNLLL